MGGPRVATSLGVTKPSAWSAPCHTPSADTVRLRGISFNRGAGDRSDCRRASDPDTQPIAADLTYQAALNGARLRPG